MPEEFVPVPTPALPTGPVAYPTWETSDAGDILIQQTGTDSGPHQRAIAILSRAWNDPVVGVDAAYPQDNINDPTRRFVILPTNIFGYHTASSSSALRMEEALYLGMIILRPIELAKVGDEIRELEAALFFEPGSLMGTSTVPEYVIVGGVTRRLMRLLTGEFLTAADMIPMRIVFRAPVVGA